MIRITSVVLLAGLLAAGCRPAGVASGSGLLADKTPPSMHSLVYSLPRTVIRVEVHATLTEWRKGPYYEFAGKYLGSGEGITHSRSEWALTRIDIKEYLEPDPRQFYVYESDAPFVFNALKMSDAGLIMLPGEDPGQEFSATRPFIHAAPSRVAFTELGFRGNRKTVVDTTYRLFVTDTGYVRRPHPVKRTEWKTTEDKASEAADFIHTLQKRKYRLLIGKTDPMPDGKAMELAYNEMNRMEEEYLALFMGKTFVDEYMAVFEITPDQGMKGSSHVLFRFSPEKGILPVSDLSGSPVAILFRTAGHEGPQPVVYKLPEKKETEPVRLFYRIPEQVSLAISDGKKTLAEKNLQVYQFGTLLSVSGNFVFGK